MDSKSRQKILIVDDVPENIKILSNFFKEDYITLFAKDGTKAIEIAQIQQPDLILLDIMMPGMNGYEVCEHLKSLESTQDIPIIFISAKSEVDDETKGLEVGAVDYISKPFKLPIVKARVQTHLKLMQISRELKRLYTLALDSNPLTGLPGNNSIARRIEQAIASREEVGVLYADLDHFKPYNDKYGFANGDKVILFTQHVIKDVLKELSVNESFIGHVGGDDFVVIVPSTMMNEVAQKTIELFDSGIKEFYQPEDAKKGCFYSINRKGEKETFPLVSISISGVNIQDNQYKNYLEVNDACADAKKKAKAIKGSSYFRDRRKV